MRTAIPIASGSSRVYVGDPKTPQANATFAYVGNGGGMTVVGPATGIRYLFRASGAQVEVDARDRPMLANLRLLRQVK